MSAELVARNGIGVWGSDVSSGGYKGSEMWADAEVINGLHEDVNEQRQVIRQYGVSNCCDCMLCYPNRGEHAAIVWLASSNAFRCSQHIEESRKRFFRLAMVRQVVENIPRKCVQDAFHVTSFRLVQWGCIMEKIPKDVREAGARPIQLKMLSGLEWQLMGHHWARLHWEPSALSNYGPGGPAAIFPGLESRILHNTKMWYNDHVLGRRATGKTNGGLKCNNKSVRIAVLWGLYDQQQRRVVLPVSGMVTTLPKVCEAPDAEREERAGHTHTQWNTKNHVWENTKNHMGEHKNRPQGVNKAATPEIESHSACWLPGRVLTGVAWLAMAPQLLWMCNTSHCGRSNSDAPPLHPFCTTIDWQGVEVRARVMLWFKGMLEECNAQYEVVPSGMK
ncbi:hypothetical protein DFH09DRAFT_1081065 [Mycena vulgaris]|nr:hypothetical protein DFH09DRAFT_1081065 [Mycena vulgaris]